MKIISEFGRLFIKNSERLEGSERAEFYNGGAEELRIAEVLSN